MGRIFLSCEGKAKRARIELPSRHAGSAETGRNGTLLLRPSGTENGPFVVLQYSAPDARTLAVQMGDGVAGGHGFAALGRLLALRPHALDLLVSSQGATSFSRVSSFVMPLRSGEGDLVAIEGFATACLQRDRRSDTTGR